MIFMKSIGILLLIFSAGYSVIIYTGQIKKPVSELREWCTVLSFWKVLPVNTHIPYFLLYEKRYYSKLHYLRFLLVNSSYFFQELNKLITLILLE